MRSREQQSFEKIRENFRGSLVGARDEGYDEARRMWNGAIDKRPRLIARCADASDVVAAVRWAREYDVEISVRGGGPGVSGALSDGGIVIDCSAMAAVEVDPARRIGRVDPGLLLGDLTRVTLATVWPFLPGS